MFKPQVFRRSFSLFRRTPTSTVVQSGAYHGRDAIRIQRVRIRPRFFTKSRLAGTVVLAVCAWKLLDWLGEEIEDEEIAQKVRRVHPPIPEEGAPENGDGHEITDEEENEDEEEDDDEEDDDEEDDDEEDGLIFFPTGFSRPRPRRFYRGSDPEWQAFLRLAPDRQRMDKIRGQLVTEVRDFAMKNPRFGHVLGNIDPYKGHIWIEVRFPDGPPLEYERPGIELTEDLTFRKTTRPVHDMHHKRLANALMPTNAMISVYYDMKRRIFASWQDFKKYTGLGEDPKPTVRDIIKGMPTPPVAPSPPTQTAATPNTPALPAPADTEKQVTPPLPANPALEKLGLTLPDPKQVPTMDLSYFRHVFRKHHRAMSIEPPRGTFVVTGLIEIIGDRAKMTLDVMSFYDPNLGKYVALSLNIRSVMEYKQRPRGGP